MEMEEIQMLKRLDRKVDLILLNQSGVKMPEVSTPIIKESGKDPFDILSRQEVCDQFKVNEHVLYQLTSKGKLPSHKNEGGRILRFYRHECETFFMNQ